MDLMACYEILAERYYLLDRAACVYIHCIPFKLPFIRDTCMYVEVPLGQFRELLYMYLHILCLYHIGPSIQEEGTSRRGNTSTICC